VSWQSRPLVPCLHSFSVMSSADVMSCRDGRYAMLLSYIPCAPVSHLQRKQPPIPPSLSIKSTILAPRGFYVISHLVPTGICCTVQSRAGPAVDVVVAEDRRRRVRRRGSVRLVVAYLRVPASLPVQPYAGVGTSAGAGAGAGDGRLTLEASVMADGHGQSGLLPCPCQGFCLLFWCCCFVGGRLDGKGNREVKFYRIWLHAGKGSLLARRRVLSPPHIGLIHRPAGRTQIPRPHPQDAR